MIQQGRQILYRIERTETIQNRKNRISNKRKEKKILEGRQILYRRKERICYIEQEEGQETYINERKGHMAVKYCIGRMNEHDIKQEIIQGI